MEQTQSKNSKIIWLIAIVVLVIVVFGWLTVKKSAKDQTNLAQTPINQTNVPVVEENNEIKATFNCQNGSSIQAVFNNQEQNVSLILSDSRSIVLPRAISASGARYANTDESFVFWNKGDTAFIEENGKTTFQDCATGASETTNNPNVGIANPASVNCTEKGGQLKMAKKPDGSEYGLCYFEDNRACEEWAMFRGECPIGGVKTTGFDTEAQSFCAWSGGKTLAVENAVCTFSDGSTCLADDFYAGTCQKGANP